MAYRRRLGEMANRFEQASFNPGSVHSPRLREALGPHQQHRERIQNELREFLSADEARETATRAYNLALDIDEDIGRLLKDPLVRRLYEYDGQFFTPRGTRLFHTAFDGLHLLRSLSDSILQAFFRGREKHSAIRWLLEELGKHAWAGQGTKDELGGIPYFGLGAERGARSNSYAFLGARERGRSRPGPAVSRRTSFLPVFRGANGKTGMRRRERYREHFRR